MTCLGYMFDYFQVLSKFDSSVYFQLSGRGEEGYRTIASLVVWRTWHTGSKDRLVPVSTFTGNKMESNNLPGEQLPDRPEPAQIAPVSRYQSLT